MMGKTKQRIGFKLNVLVMAIFLFVVSVVSLLAGNEPLKISDWQVVGPDGGDVRVITVDPKDKDRLYISTLDGQIHTSADGGKTWRLLVNLNRPQLVLDQLFVDSRDSKIIYASGHRHKEPGGFFKTTDGGATWKEAKDLSKASIHSMVQSDFDPNIILVGTIDGVWMSKNSGDDWKKISSDTMPINIDSLAIDPRSTDTIYAGTWWRAYKSTDSGKNWRLIKDGMIDDSDVFAITIDTKNPDHIVASACSGIYESYNKGEKWAKVNGIPSQSRRTRDILQNPAIPGTIYAATTEGFWMTTNGGKSWALTTTRDLVINSITVHPENPNKVFVGTDNYGVMVSDDGGKNFVPTNSNFTSRFTYSITPDIERSNRLFAITHSTASGSGFLFVSDDEGKNWQAAKNLDVRRIKPFAIIQDRKNADLLYLATNVGLFNSSDRGNSWTQLTAPPPTPKKTTTRSSKRRSTKSKTAVKPKPLPATTDLASTVPLLKPALEEKIKVLTYTEDDKNGIWAGTDSGLYRSYDVKKGWEKVSLGKDIDENIFAIHTSPLLPGTIWVGTSVSGVMISRDDGETWQKVVGVPENIPVSYITIDPQRPQNVYVGTSQTFYLSRDGGRVWMRRGGNLPLGNYASILINPNNTDEIYTASALESDGGIFFSSDAGMNWTRIDTKDLKLPSHRVWTMAFDPNDSNRIFAGTHSSGVYKIERKVSGDTAAETIARPKVIGTGN